MVKVMIKIFFSLLIVGLIAGLSLLNTSSWARAATIVPGQDITIKGKVKFIDVEGGCYQLITTDNIHYELQGEFPKQDGFIVKVQGTIAPDLVTTCQVGKPFQVRTFQVLKNR
jgi:hypothetical protein